MASVFEVLDEIRRRPGLYVGGDETQRMNQLQNLEQLLTGYTLALRQHTIHELVADFCREFTRFLSNRHGWSGSCGAVSAIRDATANDEEAWVQFWRLVEEFRTTVVSP